jgi:hypothetical protein
LRKLKSIKGGFFGIFFYSYNIQHCFICRPSDPTVPTDAGTQDWVRSQQLKSYDLKPPYRAEAGTGVEKSTVVSIEEVKIV